MNHLNKRRDELAEIHVPQYESDKFEEYTLTGTYLVNRSRGDFKIGFDTALSELKPEIDRLVEALEFISREKKNISKMKRNIAYEALQKWREFKGE